MQVPAAQRLTALGSSAVTGKSAKGKLPKPEEEKPRRPRLEVSAVSWPMDPGGSNRSIAKRNHQDA